MSFSHGQQKEKVQEFLRWYDSKEGHKEGRGGNNCDEPRLFMPKKTLGQYLHPSKVGALLDDVLHEDERDDVDEDEVSKSYLISFAILLVIGHGSFICRFVQHDSLKDARLPFTARPSEFPFLPQNFFPIFEAKQWEFCAPRINFNFNYIYNSKSVLPIVSKTRIGEGGSSYAYKIEIEEEYNALGCRNKSPDQSLEIHRNTYVLKTYRSAEAEQNWNDERAAFKQLKPSPNIVTCYGAFQVAASYHMILEWADKETLEHFLQRNQPPPNQEEMTLFWARFLKVTNGLQFVHGSLSHDGKSRQMNGFHQDIKPANILVFGCDSLSAYDCQFKIADLGLAHFQSTSTLPHELTVLDACGTRDYGAPETLRYSSTANIPLHVSQKVDVWSMGCIISEMIVWSLWGSHGVMEYRRRRANEIRDCNGGDNLYRFYHNDQLLKVVNDKHQSARDECQLKDTVTKEILLRMMEDMLIVETYRDSAARVMNKAETIIQESINRFGLNLERIAGRSGGYDAEISGDSQPTPPAQWPPSMDTTSTPELTSSRDAGSSPSLPEPARGTVRNSTYGAHPRSTTLPYGAAQPYASQNIASMPGQAPASPSRWASNSAYHPANMPYKEFPHRPRHSDNSGSGAGLQPTGMNNATGLQDISHPPDNTHEATSSYQGDIETPKTGISSRRQEKQPETNAPPRLKLDEGLKWRALHKAWSLKRIDNEPKLANSSSNFMYLGGRDHVLLVDNSKSMKMQKHKVKPLVTLLAYMLKKQDKDGLDIEFASSANAKHSRRSSVLVDELDRVGYEGETDMYLRLSRLFEKYKAGERARQSQNRRLSKFLPTSEPQRRKLSFYILTDGKWNSSDAGPAILNLAKNMEDNNLPKDDIGIQFIRFGQDEIGKKTMKDLDDKLGLKERNMDFVDTTFWNGNIWKQLLGAISPHYDDIEDDEEEVDEWKPS